MKQLVGLLVVFLLGIASNIIAIYILKKIPFIRAFFKKYPFQSFVATTLIVIMVAIIVLAVRVTGIKA